jgi:hypothetical protein
VTKGLEAGQSGVGVAPLTPPVSSPSSPEAKKTLMPVAAAWICASSWGLMYPVGSASPL